METLSDGPALRRAIDAVPRGAPGFTTNFYAAADQVARWAAVAPLRSRRTADTLLLLRPDRDFEHVYHVAESLPALTGALRALPPGRYATDLLGQGRPLDEACLAYADAGFQQRAFLARMVRVQTPAAGVVEDTLGATADDVPRVTAFLEQLLDRFTEQLPDAGELLEAAADGRLLVVRRGSAIAGMLLYDRKEQRAHLRFWHVMPEAQGTGVGRQLMAAFLARCATVRRIVLWVVGDNDRSIAIYNHYGFKADGLLDRIMFLQKESQE